MSLTLVSVRLTVNYEGTSARVWTRTRTRLPPQTLAGAEQSSSHARGSSPQGSEGLQCRGAGGGTDSAQEGRMPGVGHEGTACSEPWGGWQGTSSDEGQWL